MMLAPLPPLLRSASSINQTTWGSAPNPGVFSRLRLSEYNAECIRVLSSVSRLNKVNSIKILGSLDLVAFIKRSD